MIFRGKFNVIVVIVCIALCAAACFTAFAAPARAAEVAVLDVARVIDASKPGKAAQRYVDELKVKLEAELESYKKSSAGKSDSAQLIAQRQRQLTERYQAEYARVTTLVRSRLDETVVKWLNSSGGEIRYCLICQEALSIFL